MAKGNNKVLASAFVISSKLKGLPSGSCCWEVAKKSNYFQLKGNSSQFQSDK